MDNNANDLSFTLRDETQQPHDWFELDVDKIHSLEDIITILAGMKVTVYGKGPQYDALKPFLKSDPIRR